MEMSLDSAMTLSGTFEMRAERRPDGQIHVGFRNPELAVATGKAGKGRLTIMELIPLLPLTFGPTIAISPDATFSRVEGAAGFRSALIDLVNANLAVEETAKIREFVPTMVEQATSDQNLAGLSSLRWQGMVGMWNGGTLTQGEVDRWAERLPVPMAGEPTIQYQFESEFVGRVPCSAAESAKRCVELVLVAEVAEPDRREYAEAVQRLRPSADGTRFEIPEMRIEHRLVTDPDTLLPYRYRQSTRGGMKMIESTSTMETRREDDLELIYMYPAGFPL